ncbi:dddP [Symbiodinium natans]|uniref:DddP protein n=1 Tax=Symbiodinium natans TaxID=878477 RepID=A0A812N0J3_9DINO|nr:dddP [Symbiodinium natans]
MQQKLKVTVGHVFKHSASLSLLNAGDQLRANTDFMRRLRQGRHERLRRELRRHNVSAAVIFDPINVRYAVDFRSMIPFYLRNPTQYLVVPADETSKSLLFAGSFGSDALLADFNGTLEFHPAVGATMASAGPREDEKIDLWVEEMDKILGKLAATSPHGKRVAIERFQERATRGLRDRGYDLIDAQIPIEYARSVKSEEEITAIRYGIKVVEEGVHRLREALAKPEVNITENEVWSILHATVVACDGEYVETRLFNSGPKTNPWMQESGTRKITAGETVQLDTDVVGPFGYYVDFSRTFTAGYGFEGFQPSEAQKKHYRLALEMVAHNMALLKPGATFANVTFNAWPIPEEFQDHKYHVQTHGTGMTGEYPYIFHPSDWESHGYDGEVVEGMTLSVEAFIGSKFGGEGVKFEQHGVIRKNGFELLSTGVPPEDYLLAGEEKFCVSK